MVASCLNFAWFCNVTGALMENIICLQRWLLAGKVVGSLNTAEMMAAWLGKQGQKGTREVTSPLYLRILRLFKIHSQLSSGKGDLSHGTFVKGPRMQQTLWRIVTARAIFNTDVADVVKLQQEKFRVRCVCRVSQIQGEITHPQRHLSGGHCLAVHQGRGFVFDKDDLGVEWDGYVWAIHSHSQWVHSFVDVHPVHPLHPRSCLHLFQDV